MRIYDFLKNTAKMFDYLANCTLRAEVGQKYYVYVPTRDKPKHLHFNYNSALNEAKRLRAIIPIVEDVQILQVVESFDAEIPF